MKVQMPPCTWNISVERKRVQSLFAAPTLLGNARGENRVLPIALGITEAPLHWNQIKISSTALQMNPSSVLLNQFEHKSLISNGHCRITSDQIVSGVSVVDREIAMSPSQVWRGTFIAFHFQSLSRFLLFIFLLSIKHKCPPPKKKYKQNIIISHCKLVQTPSKLGVKLASPILDQRLLI